MLTSRREAVIDVLLAAMIAAMIMLSGCTGLTKKETKIIYRHNNLVKSEFASAFEGKKFDKEEQEAIMDRCNAVDKLLKKVLEEK